jgi:hypothetical protein
MLAGIALLAAGRECPARETELQEIAIENTPVPLSSAYTQLFTFQLQPFQPSSLRIDNGTYIFDYTGSDGNVMSSWLLEFGWAPKLLDWNGAFYLEEQLATSIFHGGSAEVTDLLPIKGSSFSLFMVGFDTRLAYAATWFPLPRWVPFVEAGYLYSILYQAGTNGLESAQLGVGNAVAALGVRFWLNRPDTPDGRPPFFLTLRLNHVFSSPADVDLGSTALSGGLSLGL